MKSRKYKAIEFIKSKDSTYGIISSAGGMIKRVVAGRAVNKGVDKAMQGASGIIAKKAGMDKQDVHQVVSGIGDFTGVTRSLKSRIKNNIQRNNSFNILGNSYREGKVAFKGFQDRNAEAIQDIGDGITSRYDKAKNWIGSKISSNGTAITYTTTGKGSEKSDTSKQASSGTVVTADVS